jgi:monoamine oxidase
MLLQFARPFWRKAMRPRAFGTDLPIGAVWEADEEQRGSMLSLLAGGRASGELQAIVAAEGIDGVLRQLAWLGRPSPLVESWTITWEKDPWSLGGYAYFDPAFDPALRKWLRTPAGRIVFAGEHTSVESQGYMNGAIESGLRASAELRWITRRA